MRADSFLIMACDFIISNLAPADKGNSRFYLRLRFAFRVCVCVLNICIMCSRLWMTVTLDDYEICLDSSTTNVSLSFGSIQIFIRSMIRVMFRG